MLLYLYVTSWHGNIDMDNMDLGLFAVNSFCFLEEHPQLTLLSNFRHVSLTHTQSSIPELAHLHGQVCQLCSHFDTACYLQQSHRPLLDDLLLWMMNLHHHWSSMIVDYHPLLTMNQLIYQLVSASEPLVKAFMMFLCYAEGNCRYPRSLNRGPCLVPTICWHQIPGDSSGFRHGDLNERCLGLVATCNHHLCWLTRWTWIISTGCWPSVMVKIDTVTITSGG